MEHVLTHDINLSLRNLAAAKGVVSIPDYKREDLSAGILHVGLGNFHRAHQATYLHRLFQRGEDREWAIVGAGIKATDAAMRRKLQSQDWLSTIVELDPAGFSAEVIGSMIDFIDVNIDTLIGAMTRPEIRIVSLTVTEGGYFIDASTGGFDSNHADIVNDADHPDAPKTIFGVLIAALRKRRAAGIAPFTVMSCDNLPENGHVARSAVLGLAKAQSTELHDWIAGNVAFPNSMVDCITPATSDREIELVNEQFGINDAAPVVCEPFRQWVLQDHFPSGRPAFEKVGVEFVEDVAPYELMKLRILNGGHAAIAYPAGLLGIHFVHDAMRDASIAAYLDKLERDEIIPTVPEIPGVSREDYFEKVVERFSNEAIGDTIPRLCFDGANRQPKFILPPIEARLADGETVDGLAIASALWCRYCYGETDDGQEIPANDPNWSELQAKARTAREDPLSWLSMTSVYGALGDSAEFRASFKTALISIWQDGTRATLDAYADS